MIHVCGAVLDGERTDVENAGATRLARARRRKTESGMRRCTA